MPNDDVIRAYAAPVPRYTSYPTAPHFSSAVTPETYVSWLRALPARSRLSLYAHVPFCDTLCWFCGCTTKITQRYGPVKAYLAALQHEAATIGGLVAEDAEVSAIHWGGGSPTMLAAEDIDALAGSIRAAFRLAPDCSFAIEVDPRGLGADRIDALCRNGLTRVSIGVQDFSLEVQQAINRLQSFEETLAVVEAFRVRGVQSLNIDAIYGLPHQTLERLIDTIDQIVTLKPDRVALFGYAHVPWMKTHQKMIPDAALAGGIERYHHAEAAAERLVAAGYRRIGIDHFALPTDAMAIAVENGSLKRNFQGYTVDPADALIGLGASAIGDLPQGYVQNDAATARYMRAVSEGRLATTRGIGLSDEDRVRRSVIEALMCDLSFDARRVQGPLAPVLAEEAAAIVAEDAQGFVVAQPGGFRVTEAGRPFLRTFAARFDTYLAAGKARHSAAV